MKNHIDHLTESAESVRLADAAKDRIRERLVAHMRAHPLPSATPLPSPYQRLFSRISSLYVSHTIAAATILFVVLISLGGVTASAATGALPGDLLYPMKVGVVEPIRGILAASPEARARWQVSLVEARMYEVEQLATKKQLTREEGAASKERFDTSLQASQDRIERLSQHNPEAAIHIEDSFTESLDRYENRLTHFGTDASSTAPAADESINTEEAHSFANHIKTRKGTFSKKVRGTPQKETRQNQDSEEGS